MAETGGAGGNVTINGGVVNASGADWSAGIGGGTASGYNITINDGEVTANGGYCGSGIGGGDAQSGIKYGYAQAQGYNIVINGGKVTANGGYGSASIGGARAGSGHDIYINAGLVFARNGIRTESNTFISEDLTVVSYNSNDPSTILSHTSSEDISTAINAKGGVEIFEHPHDWDGLEITEDSVTVTCNDVSHRHVGSNAVTATITRSDSQFTGQPINAKIYNLVGWTKNGHTAGDITYEGRDTTVYASSKTAPTNIGKYTASVELTANIGTGSSGTTSTCAISVDYEILKRSWETLPVISVKDFDYASYDDSIPANLPTNDIGITEDIAYFFNTENSNEGGQPWDKAALNLLDSGTYYVYAVLTENANMYGCITDPTPFTINHKHQYGYTKSGESNSIIVECVSPDKSCVGDVRKITLKIEDAVYTGSAYVPTGVELFEKESGKKVTLTYTDENGNPISAPVNVGSYNAVLLIPDVTYDGTSESVTVSAPFNITPKPVTPPTAGAKKYTYNGGEQTYVLTDSDDIGCYQFSGLTGRRTNAGTQDVVVELVSTTNYKWDDETTDPITLKDAFTIGRMAIPVPYADPRYFVENGSNQKFLALYVIDNYYYNFDGVFYNVTNNIKSNGGLTFASVTPGDNFCWADGTTRAISGWNFPFYMEKRSISASVNMLKDNRTGRGAEGYVWGYYTQSPNSSDLYVKTHYTPNLSVYTSDVKNMRVEYYVTDGKNTWNWNNLTYKDLKYYDGNNVGQSYKYYYVYAKIYSSNYETYTTPYSYFFVFKPGCILYGYKTVTWKEKVKHESWAKRHVVYYKDETQSRNDVVFGRAFIDLPEVGSTIGNAIRSGQCSLCMFSMYLSNNQAKFDSSNLNKLPSLFGAATPTVSMVLGSQINKDDFAGIVSNVESEVGEEFSTETLQLNVESAVNNSMSGAELSAKKENASIFGNGKNIPDAPSTRINIDSTLLSQLMSAGTTEDAKVTVTYDKGYYTFDDEADAYNGNFVEGPFDNQLGTLVPYRDPGDNPGNTFLGWYYFPEEVFGQNRELDINEDGVKWDFDNDIIETSMTLYGRWQSSEDNEEETKTVAISGGGMIRTENPYSDVKESDYYYNAVVWANKYGVTRGKTPVLFDPVGSCTRSEFITFLWRSIGEPAVDYNVQFTDVDMDSYYGQALRWAASIGIVKGTTDTTFSPKAKISRAQAISYIARFAGISEDSILYTNKFKDVSDDAYYATSVAWASENKITNGKTFETFEPDADCLRSHVVVFLYNYFNK